MPKCEYGCGREGKFKITKKKKWCCEPVFNKCPAVLNRIKETMLERFGVENPSQHPDIIKKMQQTCLDKYGVKNPGESEVIKEKMKQTCVDKYGVEYTFQTEEMKNKSEQTCLDKYGVKNPGQCESIVNRRKQTMKERYGGEYSWESPELYSKMKQTLKDKYGVDNIQQLAEYRQKLRLKALERIQQSLENGYQIQPRFNPDACTIIDEYGKKHGYNFQHAMNGGEHCFKELGYWVDGYDTEKNTVIEVDEAHHFDVDGNLSEKDIRRQEEIEEHIGCMFIRLRI